jgi:hypothetical protein
MSAGPGAPGGHAVRSHRRASRLDRLGDRLVTAALVLAALLAGGALTGHLPGVDAQQEAFVRTGAAGRPVHGRTFDMTLLGVRGGTKIASHLDTRDTRDTSGVWVLARVRLVAHGEPLTVKFAAVVDARGRQYYATDRISQDLVGARLLEPEIPVAGEIAFEVPPADAVGLRLRLAGERFDTRMDAMPECRLPVDGAMVRRWRAGSQPLRVNPPEVAP